MIDNRFEKLEAIHSSGGTCEANRTLLWKELASLRERVVALEVKLLLGGTFLSIVGPMVANWLMK